MIADVSKESTAFICRGRAFLEDPEPPPNITAPEARAAHPILFNGAGPDRPPGDICSRGGPLKSKSVVVVVVVVAAAAAAAAAVAAVLLISTGALQLALDFFQSSVPKCTLVFSEF